MPGCGIQRPEWRQRTGPQAPIARHRAQARKEGPPVQSAAPAQQRCGFSCAPPAGFSLYTVRTTDASKRRSGGRSRSPQTAWSFGTVRQVIEKSRFTGEAPLDLFFRNPAAQKEIASLTL